MPDYRRLHHCFDMGERTSQVTDFELRVWLTYRACADDYGVCPMLVGNLRGKSRRLARETDAAVEAALDHIVAVGLALVFEHQGLRYLCQPDWQDWEQCRYPRLTEHPAPPPKIFRKLSVESQDLFRKFHAKFQNIARLPRAGARKTETLTETLTVRTEESLRETKSAPPKHAPSAAGPSPLAWGKKHSDHVAGFCDWMCFPEDLAKQFAQRLNRSDPEAGWHAAKAWATGIRRAWEASGDVPAGRMYDWWNDRWTEAHGDHKPETTGVAGRHARTKQRLDDFVEHG